MVNPIKSNRGQILVLVALSLVVLLGFAALAIDVGYFYHTKNQLQGAADASALAGAAALVGNDTTQTNARTAAVNYAFANIAAGSPVQIGNDNDVSNVGNDNDGSNVFKSGNPGNDITVGNWDPASSPTYSTTRTPINAMQVRARRTADSPGGGVNRFFGKIFRSDQQDIPATAIAKKSSLHSPALALCTKSCSINQTTFFNINSAATQTFSIAWTTFSYDQNSTSADAIRPYVNGDKTADMTALCNAPACTPATNSGITTNNGVTAPYNDLGVIFRDPTFDKNNKTIVNNVVTEWRVAIAIVGYDCDVGATDPNKGCPPSAQGKAERYGISGWAKAVIIEVCDKEKNVYNNPLCTEKGVVISSLQCADCGSDDIDDGFGSIKARLVQ